MSHQHAVADFQRETYPAYESKLEDGYVQGYNPMSLAAPHSSLLRNSTWIGMGLVLSILPAAGILIWGLGVMAYPFGTAGEQNYTMWVIVGVISILLTALLGFLLIHYGRRYYREFAERQKQDRKNVVRRGNGAGVSDNAYVSDDRAREHGNGRGNAQPVDAQDL